MLRLTCRFPFHTLALAGLLTAAGASCAFAQPVQPCASGAYRGYTPAGAKGAMKTDIDWHRRVRAVPSTEAGQACLRYALRAAARLGTFDSLQSTSLGGVTGFLAQRGAQAWLLTALGQDVLDGPFDGPLTHVPQPPQPPGTRAARESGSVLLSFTRAGATHYARLHKGQVVARSPHGYAAQGAASELQNRYPPAPGMPLRQVQAAGQGAGLLDVHSLREVVPTRYQASGVLTGDGRMPWLLFGQGGGSADAPSRRVDFFLPDGTPLDWPATRAFALHAAPGGALAYLALHDPADTACRYINAQRQPLLPAPVPKPAGQPCPLLQEGQPLRFTSADGQVHRYRYSLAGGLQALGPPLPGRLLASGPGRFVLQHPQGRTAAQAAAGESSAPDLGAAAPGYQVYRDDGQPLPDALGFSGFEDLGCGRWRLLREGVWYTLDAQGQLSLHASTPSAC